METLWGQNPGDLAFTANGIPVHIWDLQVANPIISTVFDQAYIDAALFFSFGSGQTIRTNNINLEFDFSSLSFPPSQVTLDFLDASGTDNLSVNGSSPVFVGDLAAAPTPLGGATVKVAALPIPLPARGKTGTATLSGKVTSLRIGGQELWIDNVCAKP